MSLGRDGVVGLILFGISLALFVHSFGLPHLPLVPVGPGFYPRLVLAFIALASAVLVWQDWGARRAPSPASADAGAPVRRNYRGVVLLFAIVTGYVALLPLLGFRVATALFVGAAQGALEPPRTPQGWAVLVAVAVATAFVTHVIFEHYLLVLLPRGSVTGW